MKSIATPVLTQIGNQPLYSAEIPMELEMYMFSFPSLVFRIEYSPGQFVYQWMVDIMFVDEMRITDYLLDLSSFNEGSQLNVAFAFVSQEMGLSPYSGSMEVVVPGTKCIYFILLCVGDSKALRVLYSPYSTVFEWPVMYGQTARPHLLQNSTDKQSLLYQAFQVKLRELRT